MKEIHFFTSKDDGENFFKRMAKNNEVVNIKMISMEGYVTESRFNWNGNTDMIELAYGLSHDITRLVNHDESCSLEHAPYNARKYKGLKAENVNNASEYLLLFKDLLQPLHLKPLELYKNRG